MNQDLSEASRIRRQVSFVYQAPVWIPDHVSTSCMQCKQLFTFYKRRHHCRSCGNLICSNCLSSTFVVPGIDTNRIMKACSSCMNRIKSDGLLEVLEEVDSDSISVCTRMSDMFLERKSIDTHPLSTHIDNTNVSCNGFNTLKGFDKPRIFEKSRPLSYAPKLWSNLARLSIGGSCQKIERNRMSVDTLNRKSSVVIHIYIQVSCLDAS